MDSYFSEDYKLICLFFKEIKLYHEFIKYQRDGEKYVNWQCSKIPFDTEKPVQAFGNTSISSWIEHMYGVKMKYKLYELFKIWFLVNYPHRGGEILFGSSLKIEDVFDRKTRRFKYDIKDLCVKL